MSVLTLHRVTKQYSGTEFPAVNCISFTVEENQIVALVGKSGSGKTTALRIIAGFEIPETGTVKVSGDVVFDETRYVAPEKRGIGMVFQDYALFPHLSVFDNVQYGLHAIPSGEREQRVYDALVTVGLAGYAKRYPHELSGGEQQRVALARSMAPHPKLLLLDEPFSNLDDIIKGQVRKEIRNIIRENGITALFVTHDVRDAFTVADKIIVLQGGVIQQEGTPQEIYLKPANQYVANLFGKANIIPATVNGEALETCFGRFECPEEFRNNSAVQLVIRPEHISVNSSEGNGLRGVIEDVVFLGARKELRVSPQEVPESFQAEPDDFVVVVDEENPVSIGDTCVLTINSEKIHLWRT